MLGLFLSAGAVISTIGIGVLMHRARFQGSRRLFVGIVSLSCCLLLAGALFTLLSAPAVAAEAPTAVIGADKASSNGLGFIGMALATGLACIGAGIAVGSVGSAALGLVGEQPGAIGTTLIYVGLAEGVAIYGIVISMLIFSRLAS
ncbi:MAG: ATP synthase subunit C [Synergistaceae bacterium]|jgi:V/A-type H+-transporting ATPase subunit K|nr:ATP synthase subunit C [Synergistaceae bacterium]